MTELSEYARRFDKTNINWQRSAERNEIFLQLQQNYFNDALLSRGHVFLNEVYDALGFPRSSAGQLVGWLYGEGVGCIKFMVSDDGMIDFNVDGEIYLKIEED
jgi:hypothetical protein